MEDGTTYLNDELVRILNISQEYIDEAKSEQIEEIKRRRSLYQNKDIEDNSSLIQNTMAKSKTVVLADDGVATGATLINEISQFFPNPFYARRQELYRCYISGLD